MMKTQSGCCVFKGRAHGAAQIFSQNVAKPLDQHNTCRRKGVPWKTRRSIWREIWKECLGRGWTFSCSHVASRTESTYDCAQWSICANKRPDFYSAVKYRAGDGTAITQNKQKLGRRILARKACGRILAWMALPR